MRFPKTIKDHLWFGKIDWWLLVFLRCLFLYSWHWSSSRGKWSPVTFYTSDTYLWPNDHMPSALRVLRCFAMRFPSVRKLSFLLQVQHGDNVWLTDFLTPYFRSLCLCTMFWIMLVIYVVYWSHCVIKDVTADSTLTPFRLTTIRKYCLRLV